MGHILATAIESSSHPPTPLAECAYDEGRRIGESAHRPSPDGRQGVTSDDDLESLSRTLSGQGYEPRIDDDVLMLCNCPFDSLAREHTDLVCGVNQSYVQGVADGLECPDLRACLEPAEGRCCVTVRRAGHD